MKKKWIFGLATLTTAFLAIGLVACNNGGDVDNSGDETKADLEYVLSEDGTYYVLKGLGTSTNMNVVVPSDYQGKPVKEIGAHAFNNDDITSIVIGDKVEIIGNDAFHDCYDLTSIVIGKSVTQIKERVFMNCTALESIDVSAENTAFADINGNLYTKDGKVLMQYALGNTATDFVTPNGVETILKSAFTGSKFLTNAKIVCDTIEESAFSNCNALVNLEVDCENIGKSAFFSCDNLQYVKFGYAVRSVGGSAFYECSRLEKIVIGDLVEFGTYSFYGCQIKHVFYTGTSNAWTESNLTSATKYTYIPTQAELPNDDGNYWYYDEDGKAAVWEL